MKDQKVLGNSILNRRDFIGISASAALLLAMGSFPESVHASAAHILPPLPYADNALEPVISAKTIDYHFGKHHRGYVDNLNKLVARTEYADLSLEKIIPLR